VILARDRTINPICIQPCLHACDSPLSQLRHHSPPFASLKKEILKGANWIWANLSANEDKRALAPTPNPEILRHQIPHRHHTVPQDVVIPGPQPVNMADPYNNPNHGYYPSQPPLLPHPTSPGAGQQDYGGPFFEDFLPSPTPPADPLAPIEEEKRRRNTAASARFRVKKKERELALEKTAQEMTEKVVHLESKVQGLETENKWLRGLIVEKNKNVDGAPETKFESSSRTGSKNGEKVKGKGGEKARSPGKRTDGVGTSRS
jgi:hypothetical protein